MLYLQYKIERATKLTDFTKTFLNSEFYQWYALNESS